MFNLNFKEKQIGPDQLILKFGLWFRFFFFTIAGFILYVIFVDSKPGDTNTGPYIFVTICLILGSYYEAWIFDMKSDQVIKRQGFFFLYFSRYFKISEIEQIVVRQYVKGGLHKPAADPTEVSQKKMFQKEFSKLTLDYINGDCFDIEVVNGRDKAQIIAKAEAISRLTGKPMVKG